MVFESTAVCLARFLVAFVGLQPPQALRSETEGKSTLIGFVGAPWTLAAYSIEGGSSKYALHTKKMMMEDPSLFHSLMTKLANSIGDYACYQVKEVQCNGVD